jgi:hypothetical protein
MTMRLLGWGVVPLFVAAVLETFCERLIPNARAADGLTKGVASGSQNGISKGVLPPASAPLESTASTPATGLQAITLTLDVRDGWVASERVDEGEQAHGRSVRSATRSSHARTRRAPACQRDFERARSPTFGSVNR